MLERLKGRETIKPWIFVYLVLILGCLLHNYRANVQATLPGEKTIICAVLYPVKK
jgi:hypothetical protein